MVYTMEFILSGFAFQLWLRNVTDSKMGRGRKAKNWQPCQVVALEGNSVRDAAILWLEQKGASHSSLMSSTLGRVNGYTAKCKENVSCAKQWLFRCVCPDRVRMEAAGKQLDG